MNDWPAAILLLAGCIFIFLAALGVLRLPDIYCRMHAATKAPTFGCALLILAALFHQPSLSLTIKGTLILLFIFLTAPISGHMLGRAAHRMGVPLWPKGARDDLAPTAPPSPSTPPGQTPPK